MKTIDVHPYNREPNTAGLCEECGLSKEHPVHKGVFDVPILPANTPSRSWK